MKTINDGGQAFPLLSKWDDKKLNGMTLRDYFAAKAMASFVLHYKSQAAPAAAELIAKWSYQHADAMLKAREAR